MNDWSLLGIEPTTDTTTIKRAYSQKLKVYHPEEDPQGFQRLREAYENVLRQAKYLNEDRNVVTRVELSNCNNISPILTTDMMNDRVSIPEHLVDEFMNEVKAVYDHVILRKNIESWKQILNDERYWHLDIKQKLNYRMLSFLRERFETGEPILPFEVWTLLNQHFFWLQQEQELCALFSEDFVTFIVKKISEKPLSTSEKWSHFLKGYYPSLRMIFLIILGLTIIIALSYINSGFSGGILALAILGWQWIADKTEKEK